MLHSKHTLIVFTKFLSLPPIQYNVQSFCKHRKPLWAVTIGIIKVVVLVVEAAMAEKNRHPPIVYHPRREAMTTMMVIPKIGTNTAAVANTEAKMTSIRMMIQEIGNGRETSEIVTTVLVVATTTTIVREIRKDGATHIAATRNGNAADEMITPTMTAKTGDTEKRNDMTRKIRRRKTKRVEVASVKTTKVAKTKWHHLGGRRSIRQINPNYIQCLPC